ncbi:Crp/Fnr family transcriptional regulator [Mucilaginibacter aquaedulcis]|uniref:Crp/Fnr family transcriptional regulator n=1 Tax=Mucilaginibacter aquaedulcis TaxID=1187081 RepID=UPI0025B38C2D|nr:Crp/Fnr family transcriptional regulator [Mucilaginibacter aquaedulcis]MDN3548198.1 Crp/Fnr family transcriptional regulator [Mucilaginibacter aquaedulcis]
MKKLLREHFEKIIALTDSEFDYIYDHFVFKKIIKHQFLIQQGDRVHNEYFVVKGCLKSYMIDSDDKAHILQFALPDWWVSDYQALNNGSPSTLYLDSVDGAEILSITMENKDKLCAEMHKVEHFFRKKTNWGYVALQQRILSLLNSNAKDRYEQLLKQYPALFKTVPKQLLASYLGVTRETLSRLYTPAK